MFGLGNPKGEIIHCPICNRFHDILRGTGVLCACGTFVKSKEFSQKLFQDKLNDE